MKANIFFVTRREALRSRCREIICLILAAWMALSGMRLDDSKADATIWHSCDSKASVSIQTTELPTCNSQAICSAQNSKIQLSKKEAGISPEYLNSDSFSFEEKLFCVSSETNETQIFCQDGLVVNYIHKTDGKKRF